MRYSRQELFREIGKEGQQKIRGAAVAIVGLGALGSVSAELLARAGIGKLILIDRDIIELSNLQRQSLYLENDVGLPKSSRAKERLLEINGEVKVISIIDDLNYGNIYNFINKNANNFKNNENYADLILDCTDNLETRFLINDFSIKNKIPFIYSSAVGSKGYIFNVIPEKSPCLRCFLKPAANLDTCETAGVLNTITHLISSTQVNEAIKIILGKNYEKSLLFFDIWKNELSRINVNKNQKCLCCADNSFEYLDGKNTSRTVKLCGHNIFQVKNVNLNKGQFKNLKDKLSNAGKIRDLGSLIIFEDILTIFENGRALVKAKDGIEAKTLYSKYVGD